jgi:aminopeptidase N
MENWGLIKYREARLLYDENKTSDIALQNIVSVISHETAHLWFGNLVSPKWWSNLWLKEGFARFMEYYATDSIKPEWGMRDQFAFHVFNMMQIDSVASSHRITAEVNTSAEITGLFDDISYGKVFIKIDILCFY